MAESWNGTADQTDGPHTLLFKVMGSCYDKSRQSALEEAFEYLYDYNRNVFVKLEADHDNADDQMTIITYL